MMLHEDRGSFEDILQIISQQSGIRADILEKDYYVSLILRELADKQVHLPAFFKGGTALYKALGSIQRFSEDIDITVRIDDCSTTQAKRRLERASHDYKSLSRTIDKELEHNRKGDVSCVYDYEPVVGVDRNDPLQRFGHVRLEATSFTVSEPTIPMLIAPILYDKATEEQRNVLSSLYDIASFQIGTIRIERIFVDKVFAAEFYYERDLYFDVAKHLYDISVMSELDAIKALLANKTMLTKMVSYKRREENMRIGSNLSGKPFFKFTTINSMGNNNEMERTFERMQNIYIFDDAYRINYTGAVSTFTKLFPILEALDK